MMVTLRMTIFVVFCEVEAQRSFQTRLNRVRLRQLTQVCCSIINGVAKTNPYVSEDQCSTSFNMALGIGRGLLGLETEQP